MGQARLAWVAWLYLLLWVDQVLDVRRCDTSLRFGAENMKLGGVGCTNR